MSEDRERESAARPAAEEPQRDDCTTGEEWAEVKIGLSDDSSPPAEGGGSEGRE